MKTLRLGLLGCGRIGRVHAGSIQKLPQTELVAVTDTLEEAAKRLSEDFNTECRTAEEIIKSTDIDAVLIATPTSTHYDYVIQALDAGKPIICEKPIDLNAARAGTCVGAIEASGVPFMVAFNQRFDPNFGALQRRVAEGDIGSVESVSIISRDPTPPPVSYIKTSGGLFRDMMIHDLDLARYILKEEPVRVFAHGACLIDPEIGEAGDVDTASVTLITGSGRVCHISNSRRANYGYDQRIEVHGSKGMLTVANVPTTTVEVANDSGFTRDKSLDFFLERFGQAYENEIRYFADAILAGKPPAPGANDALRAQLLADAATESWQKQQVVDVPA